MSVGVIAGNAAGINILTVTIDVASVSANTTSEQTFTVPGLLPRDYVTVLKPSHSTGLGVVNARVSAADTIAITFMNNTGSAIDPAAEAYLVLVARPEGTVTPTAVQK